MNVAATVVICTRRGGAALTEACRSVLEDDSNPAAWELIVVDSTASEDTSEVIRDLARQYPRYCRTVRAPGLGLSAARTTGLRSAQGEVVAFLGDDTSAQPGWLAALTDAVLVLGADCVGGPVQPRFEAELPHWLSGSDLQHLDIWELGDRMRELPESEAPRSINMAVRREAALALQGFGEDPRGSNNWQEVLAGSGVGAELYYRMSSAGKLLLYDPRAIVRRRVGAESLEPSYFRRRNWARGFSQAMWSWKSGGIAGMFARWPQMRDWRQYNPDQPIWNDLRKSFRRSARLGYIAGVATVLVGRLPRHAFAKLYAGRANGPSRGSEAHF